MSKNLVYKDATVEVYLEEYLDKIFIHGKIHAWSKEIYLRLTDLWVDLVEELHLRGYKEVYVISDNDKLDKFASMFGFNLAGIEEDTDRRLLRWA